MASDKYMSGLCDTMDWRPLDFLDLPPKLSCSLCNVVSGKTFALPCCHAVCELCYDVLLKGGRRCPLDKECFDESCVQTSSFTRCQVETRQVLCTNSKDGCTFVGTVEEMKHHFLSECNFHAVTCKFCETKVLRREIANHYIQEQCQRGKLSRRSDCSGSDLTLLEAKSYPSVKGLEDKITGMEQQQKELQELLKKILDKQDRVDNTVSNAGNEFHEQVKEQTRICSETVIGRLERSLVERNRPIEDSIRRSTLAISSTQGYLAMIEKQCNKHGEIMAMNERLLNRVLEKQEAVGSDVRKVVNEFQDLHASEAKVVNDEADKRQTLLEKLVQETSGLSTDIKKATELMESYEKRSPQQLQFITDGMAGVTRGMTQLSSTEVNLHVIKRDLNVLLQRSEEVTKYVDGKEEKVKSMAKAIFEIKQNTRSIEEAVNHLHLVESSDCNEVFWHIQGIADFEKRMERPIRYSDTFTFYGYTLRLHAKRSIDMECMTYIHLCLQICRSSRDSLLKWPFSIPFTVSLVHPTDVKNWARSVIDLSRHPECFRRPITDANEVYDIDFFCELESLRDDGFIFEDSLSVSVKAIFGQKMKSVTESLNNLHRLRLSESNEVFFHIQQFSKFRSEWETTGYASRSSDVFVFCGYSVKLSVEIYHSDCGGMSLALRFYICPSSRDSLLKWPFPIPHTLMLVHPRDEKKNIERAFTDLSSFAYHRQGLRPGAASATGDLCEEEDLEARGFVFHDSLCVGVKAISDK